MYKLKSNYLIMVLLLAISITGCKPKGTPQSQNEELGSTYKSIKYSTGFNITDYDNYTKVVINNPWDKKTDKAYSTYYLYKDEGIYNDIPDDGGFKLKIPINSVIVNTFSYFEFLQQLGDLDKVVATTDAERVYNPYILRELELGNIKDLGDPLNPDIEKTLIVKSDAIISSAYIQQDNLSERAQKIGLPVIYSLEWMETTPLARAEWIKLIAEFVDKREVANKIFNEIDQRYTENINLLKDISNKPNALWGDNFQDTWYVPGGNSFNAHFIYDAGANYFFKDNKETGSIGLDIESILTQFGKADVWIGCEADSYAELEQKDRKYILLKSVKNKRVFNNRNKITNSGGNDYFESAIAHPDLILSDIIKAFHPNLLPELPFTYLKPLK